MGGGTILLFSDYLNNEFFPEIEINWVFQYLSVIVFFTIIGESQRAIIQANRQVRQNALSNLSFSFITLILSLPFVYYLGINGVLPSMALSAVISVLFLRWVTGSVLQFSSLETWKTSVFRGFSMIKLGVAMSISTLLGNVVLFIINYTLGYFKGPSEVGLYSAGILIVNTYGSFIISALSVDYIPKITSMTDPIIINKEASNHASLAILVFSPIIVFFILFMNLLLPILFTIDFLKIQDFTSLMLIALILKLFTFPFGYVSFAKADSKLFFWFEGIVGNLINLILLLFGYIYFGFIGAAIGGVIQMFVYLFGLRLILKSRYNIKIFYNQAYFFELVAVLSLSLLSFAISHVTIVPIKIMFSILILFLSLSFSLFHLKKKLGFSFIYFLQKIKTWI
jgi:O-antigen/teichoic acid export membrane protein